jgi:hypothetical protein
MENDLVYVVTAYRWGDKELHSYVVGVSRDERKAIAMAKSEESYRGGKYYCEVLEWELDEELDKRGYNPRKVLSVFGQKTKRKKEK